MTAIHIGSCTFLPDSGEIKSSTGTEILQPQNAKVFYQLAKQQDQIVSRNALMDSAWPNQIVTDESLTHAICAIRKALKNNGCGLTIETLHKRGYRLSCPCHSKVQPVSNSVLLRGVLSMCVVVLGLFIWAS